jgi:acetyl-CoA acetyltransferase
MRDIAIVSTAQTPFSDNRGDANEVELLMPILTEVIAKAGITKDRVGFVCSGSSDYLAGQGFSFVMALDAFGPWPPIAESHVDMDGAWALYESWVKLQMGKIDIALVFSYGKSSPGDLGRVLSRQLDPYYTAPLWADHIALAGLQARAGLDAGAFTEKDMAEVAAASRRDAANNPFALVKGDADAAALLADEYQLSPLRPHDCPPVTDGAAAVLLASADVARDLCERPAWIRGIDHRIEPHSLGVRDLTTSVSTTQAGERAGVGNGKVDIAELHAPFSHQQLILKQSLGLGDDVTINPSGGALTANAVMVAGLVRMAEAANRISAGEADRAVAHATSGPCLQQNLVCVLEGE